MQDITLDLNGCLKSRIGEHGLYPQTIAESAPTEIKTIHEALEATRGTAWERWCNLPHPPLADQHLTAINEIVARTKPGCQHLVVLGIGGSALGNTALHRALNPVTHNLLPSEERNAPRLHVLDNVDPVFVGATLDYIRNDDPNFDRTIINVISKSGETAETAAQFMIVRSILRAARGNRAGERIVAITDPAQGTMRAICDAENYTTLPVPEGVGGRFSVLSPVGLYSAAMCNIDISQLLAGAAAMDERCRVGSLENPAAALAWHLITLTRLGKPNHVLMPYCNALDSIADWYRQLWAESLGKRVDLNDKEVFAGATPIKALGATDQHSQIQLYREGPNDKVIGFIEVENFPHDRTIPADLKVEALTYLEGKTLSQLLNAEKRATEFALAESQRPHYTIKLPEVTAHTVGQLIWLWQMATAYAGRLLNIDAYNQPAVETGKQATFGLMGRAGYEDWNQKVRQKLST